MILADPQSREEWLRCRMRGIGGSDAACIIGRNPWKSNVQLWREKTGRDPDRRARQDEISAKPAVQFGKAAEAPVRELFLLMHPDMTCEYHEFRLYANDRYPFIYATLDGELTFLESIRGIYEGKTTTIQHARQWEEWDDRVPDHYYVQILHQLLACEWAKFVTLNAFIRYHGGEAAKMQSYTIWREDEQVQADMDMLLGAEITFWKQVQDGVEPALILPEL